jgi:hypothetical protein
MNDLRLIVSPINKKISSPSNRDFKEQLEWVKIGKLAWCWDDSKKNTAESGNYFAFYFYGTKVIIHRILKVKPPSERLPSWHKNIGQQDRNVLELSDPLKEFTWDDWIKMNLNPTHIIRDTYMVKTMNEPLVNLLKELEN